MLKYLFFFITFYNYTPANKLSFEGIHFSRDNSEISGLFHNGKDLLFVADKLSNRSIYKVIFEDKKFYYKDYLNLSNLKGHDEYFQKVIANKNMPHKLLSPFDLEGITACGKTFYLVNEQARHVLKVESNTLTQLPIDFTNIFKKIGTPLEKISVNAGFEGITVDCKRQILYIAQERDPRAIIIVDLKTMQAIDYIDFKSDLNNKKVSLDFADLYYEDDHLYILERNIHQLVKYNLSKRKVTKRYHFSELKTFKTNEIYATKKPFGMAEGISLTKDIIYIAIDNNKTPISENIKKIYNVDKDYSSILIFKRPKGF